MPDFTPLDEWHQAVKVEPPSKFADPIPPNKVMQIFEVHKLNEPVAGIFVYDFGVNFSGRPLLRIEGERGFTIKMTPGELLNEQGLVTQKWEWVTTFFLLYFKGGEEEDWYPRFSYSGFRFIQIECIPPEGIKVEQQVTHPTVLKLTGEMIYPDLKITGSFECSRPEWNGIQRPYNRRY